MDGPAAHRRSTSDVARDRAAVADLLPALVVLLVTQGSLVLLDPDGSGGGWATAWAMSPMVPAIWLVWAQVRALGRADEYQRTLQLEALAVGFGATLLLALIGNLLVGAGVGSAAASLQATFTGGTLAWLGALAVKLRADR